MKEYKTNEELLNYLESKNVIINDRNDALNKINKYTYYSIINSYKYVFKDSNNNYIKNVSFEEIYALYDFDKKLKNIFLKYCLEIETVIKSLMANQISKVYGVKDYLDVNNLDSTIDIDKRIYLINRINEEIKKNYQVHKSVTHYLDIHGFVPPFVLTKILTFGVASSYYGALKQSDRQAIAKNFKLTDKVLKQILKNLSTVRNLSAHSDRLYNYTSKFYLSFNLINNSYKRTSTITNLYMVIGCMEKLLDTDMFQEFKNEINKEIKKLSNNLHSVSVTKILDIMGFPNE